MALPSSSNWRWGDGDSYRGHDAARQRDVAMKLLPRNDGDQNNRQARRLLREAQALMSVEHRHAVTVHGTGSTDDYHYLIMDFIDGADLGHVVKENGALTGEALVATARALASGLAALHAGDVIHRDFKPSNCLLSHDGASKYATSAWLVWATPAPMPPD